jgi:hypothetical protein
MASVIQGLRARSDEERKKAAFFSLIPNADEIQQFLSTRELGKAHSYQHFYYGKSGPASYVAVTPKGFIVCLAVWNLTREQANEIQFWLDFDDKAQWSLPLFQDVVERVLGRSINPGHPEGTCLAKWWQESWWYSDGPP